MSRPPELETSIQVFEKRAQMKMVNEMYMAVWTGSKIAEHIVWGGDSHSGEY